MARLGIVVAMDNEKAVFDPFAGRGDARILQAGIGPVRAAAAAHRLIAAEGCTALASAGIAGGLAAEVAPGTLILAQTVLGPDGRAFETDPAWRLRLLSLVAGRVAHATGSLLGSDVVLRTPDAKQRAGRASGALAVDMESHAVAEVAAGAGVPFLVLRAVSDPAGAELPVGALMGVDGEGHEHVWPVIRRLARRPGELPALLRLKRDTDAALDTLRKVVTLAGGRLFGLA